MVNPTAVVKVDYNGETGSDAVVGGDVGGSEEADPGTRYRIES